MAKITAPLLSISARGSVGRTLTFLNKKRSSVARTWARPTYTRNPAQNKMRLLMSAASSAWKLEEDIVDVHYKSYYNNLAKELQMSGFNLYMRDCIAFNGGTSYNGLFIAPIPPGFRAIDWTLPYLLGI